MPKVSLVVRYCEVGIGEGQAARGQRGLRAAGQLIALAPSKGAASVSPSTLPSCGNIQP